MIQLTIYLNGRTPNQSSEFTEQYLTIEKADARAAEIIAKGMVTVDVHGATFYPPHRIDRIFVAPSAVELKVT